MAAFTSKATGNWSAGGQTTWNEVGVPGNGDTATINNSHTVTLDDGRRVGNGSAGALTIAAGGVLSIADNKTLLLYGSVDNAGDIEMGVNSALDFADAAFYLVTNVVRP